MEILPCEEVERVVDEEMELQQGPVYIKQAVYYNSDISTHCGFSEDSSDEENYKTSLPVKSEESSVCCVCGDSIPFLSKLIEHFKTHTAEVQCHLCRAKFGRVMSLALHLKNAHSKHSLLCDICGSFFSCTWHLNGHMGNHQKGKMAPKPVVKIEQPEEISINETASFSNLKTTMKDHSYFVSTKPSTNNSCDAIQKCTDNDKTSTKEALHIKTETETMPLVIDKKQNILSCSSFPLSQSEQEHLSLEVKEESNSKNRLRKSAVHKVDTKEEIKERENSENSDTDDDGNPDSLPPGDTAYNPDEDFSSDSDYNESHSPLRKTRNKMKQQSPDKKKSTTTNTNLESTAIAEKFGFQSDSPFCCYSKFAKLEKHMDDCSNKMTSTCSVCSLECENKEMLQKHTDEKHPVAGYICAFCRNIFPGEDNFKKHVCWKRLVSKMNLSATPVTQLPVVRLSDGSGQGAPSTPVSAGANTIKIIKITKTVNKSPTVTDPPPAVTSLGSTECVTLHQLLQTTPLGSAKVTSLAPQAPQTLVRPSSCVIRPKAPIHTPLVAQPLLSNPARIPTTSNPPLPTQVVVSFSPTINISTPTVVSASKPVLRSTSAANVRPVPVNVPVITPATRPTLRFPTPANSPLPTQVNVSISPTVKVSENKEMLQNHLAGYICSMCRTVFPSQDNIKNHVCWKRPTGNMPATAVTCPILRIPTPSNPPCPTQVNVSISSSVNVSTPALVSGNKPVLIQTSAPIITPVPINMPLITSVVCPTFHISTLSNPPLPTQVSFSPTVNPLRQTSAANTAPVNVPLITSVTCPTLVNALTNQPQVQTPPVQAPLQIVGIFMNQSRDLALEKPRVKPSWRSKTILPCRHCGAISRQPSLRVRHRYLHRGLRLYRCQCGRAFQRQLHLLRHQVQHAESVRFVCTRCGNTFEGANKLTWHKQNHKNGRRCAKKKCKASFDCRCGQMFARPSALLWHMLKNSNDSKHTKKLCV